MRKKLVQLLATTVIVSACLSPFTAFAGTWQLNDTGWWYQNEDASYPYSSWQLIDGNWYVFDNNGYMYTGWYNDNGTWYYLADSGAMLANQWVGNYYLGASGAMLTSTTTPDGYYVGFDGAWIPNYGQITEGWQQNSIGWWYQNADGTYLINGWMNIDNVYYYFDNNGYMAANAWIGNYYVGSNGAMLTNTTTPDGYQVDATGKWISQTSQNTQQQENSATVYWTPNGKSYHNRSNCATLSRSKTILHGTLQDAFSSGKTDPCNVCVK